MKNLARHGCGSHVLGRNISRVHWRIGKYNAGGGEADGLVTQGADVYELGPVRNVGLTTGSGWNWGPVFFFLLLPFLKQVSIHQEIGLRFERLLRRKLSIDP
jgi:hypothetical protein